jgi:uncharacterized MAPEG superfamily protein
MSKELFWLTLTAAMTGLLWVPYILDRIMVRGAMGATANPSPNDKPQSAWAVRMMAAHTNTVENLVVFVPLVFVAHELNIHTASPPSPARSFLVPPRLRRGLHRRRPGAADACFHRRLDRADDAGAGDLRDDVAWAERKQAPHGCGA